MNGQGALEYLIIIAAVLGISAIVVLFVTGALTGSSGGAGLSNCRLAAANCQKDMATGLSSTCLYCDTSCIDAAGKDVYGGENGCGTACINCKQGVLVDSGDNMIMNLVAYWKLDEGAGASAMDSSAYDNTGTIVGLPDWSTDCKSGYCLEFDGTNDYVDFGNPAALKTTGSQTIAFWIKPTEFTSRRNPYAKSYGGEGTITLEPSGYFNYYYGACGNNCPPYQGFTTATAIPLNAWTHIAIVRDLSSMKLRWYINGVLNRETAASYSAVATSTLNAYVGHGYVSRFKGSIDEFVIYGRALSSDEIGILYRLEF